MGRERPPENYDVSVFLNVPFDRAYLKLLHALIFAIHDCGFCARCALESDDGSVVRLDKLFQTIKDCRYGIHDISRTTLDANNKLPRFNMPLELGLFLGAKRFGDEVQRRKSCLILERERFRYHKFCSDISGQDVHAHNNQVTDAIAAIRKWLQSGRPKVGVPSANVIVSRYLQFRDDLPGMCGQRHLDYKDLTFVDFRTLVAGWIEANPDF